MMTLNYYITEEDYLDYMRFRYSESPILRKQVLVLRVLLPVVMLLVAVFTSDSLNELRFLLIVLLPIVALFVIFTPRLLVRSQLRLTRRMLRDGRPPFIGKHVLTLGQARFEHMQSDRASAYAYSCVQRIVMGKRCAFICVSAFGAVIVPLRAFASPSHQQSFFELLRARVEQCGQQAAPPVSPIEGEPPQGGDAP